VIVAQLTANPVNHLVVDNLAAKGIINRAGVLLLDNDCYAAFLPEVFEVILAYVANG